MLQKRPVLFGFAAQPLYLELQFPDIDIAAVFFRLTFAFRRNLLTGYCCVEFPFSFRLFLIVRYCLIFGLFGCVCFCGLFDVCGNIPFRYFFSLCRCFLLCYLFGICLRPFRTSRFVGGSAFTGPDVLGIFLRIPPDYTSETG